jgi:hypothetical protein
VPGVPHQLGGEGKFVLATRIGFVARGLLYTTIGLLVLRSGRTEDPQGAIEALGSGGGQWLLALMALGFFAYGLWRIAEAAFGMESGSDDGAETTGKRAAAGVSGLLHLLLGLQTIRLWRGAGGGQGNGAEEQASGVLGLPGGPVLLGIVALALIGGGFYQLYESYRAKFLSRLAEGAGQKEWVQWLGRAGYAARGTVFLICGFFLGKAALDTNASAAGGMDQALDWLSSPTDLIVATGLFLFGLYSLVEARYRRVQRPPIERAEQEIRSKMPG